MKEVNLLMTGSFNPVTLMHLRMMEIVKDHLREQDIVVHRGFMSPVHDSYGKEGLIPVLHRSAMLKLALESSDWIELSQWESQQATWTPTYDVLQHLSSVSFKHSVDSLSNHGSAKKKFRSATSSSNVNGCLDQPLQVMFVCGADNLANFAVPNLWDPNHIEKILTEHGLIVVTRSGFDVDNIIYENDLLHKHRKHIIIVREFIENTVSSTKIRRACLRGLSIKYLVHEKVEHYIQNHNLYRSGSKYVRVENDFGRIRFRTPVKPVRTKNIKTPIVSKISPSKKSDLEKNQKVGRLSRRSKNIVKRSQK